MKKLLPLLFAVLLFESLHAQDKIYTKDKQILDVKIIEQTHKSILYRMSDYEETAIFSIKVSQIDKIEYRNGRIDLMGNQNPRKSQPFGVSVGGGLFRAKEDGVINASINYFLIPQVCFEVNTGTQLEPNIFFSAGTKFHLNSSFSTNRITPYTGILFGSEDNDGFFQVPVGVSYISKKGFNTSISISQLFYFISSQDTFVEIKLGWNFRM